MAALVPINALGYAPGDPVTSVQMNLVNTQIPKAPNWVDGGATYNPASQLVMGGAGMRWNGPTLFSGTSATTWADGSTSVWQDGSSSEWQNGSTVTFGDGCLVTVELDCTIELFGGINVRSGGGIINVSNGGVIDFDAGSSITGSPALASGTTFTAPSGSTITIDGTFTLGNSQNVNLSPARTWTRRNLRVCTTDNPAEVEDTDSIVTSVATGDFIPSVQLGSTNTAFATLLELDDLPDGQVITSVVLRTKGDSAAPTNIDREATYRVIRWTDETTLDAMSATVIDSHTTGNWTSWLNQTITITSNSTIDRSYRYAVQVINHDVDNVDEMQIVSVVATGTATSIRV